MKPELPVLRLSLCGCLFGLLLAACAGNPQSGPSPAAVAAEALPQERGAQVPATPDVLYPELFRAVQEGELFSDQKHFVDLTPRQDPAAIRAAYLAQRGQAGFDLAGFVQAHFEEDAPIQAAAIRQDTTLREHIDGLWPVLTRSFHDTSRYSNALALPHPTAVPGGRFREVYFWDSYFTMLGLVASGEQTLSRDMLDNFAFLIDTYGHIPNGTRNYFLTRSQPPFFAYMVSEEAARGGDAVYRQYLPQLQKEYAYWMDGAQTLAAGSAHRRVVKLADGAVLNRYWDDSDQPRQEAWLHDLRTARQAGPRPAAEVYRDLRAAAESGWDFSGRWFDDPMKLATIRTTAFVPVDLNSLMYHLELTLVAACKTPPSACTVDYAAAARQRREAVERHLWNPKGYYADYDWKRQRVSDAATAAMTFPLFAGLASSEHARATAATVKARLLRPGGIATTEYTTGQQWDAPNGWAPLQWIAVEGLRRYQQDALAERIGRGFLGRVQALFAREHKLVEKYDIDADAGGAHGGGGEYPNQDGFGWTNGVTIKLLQYYGKTSPTDH
jgi:alpha,alpha-trehalase